MSDANANRPFHVMAKPAGPACNLACRYCYYLSKQQILDTPLPRIDDALLEEFIRQYAAAHAGLPEVNFAWQGGEPTLLGVDFFRRVVELERRHAPAGTRISNSIQTNATLLDEAWAEFLARNEFLVGVSLDGPRDLHDLYRRDARGEPTFDRTMAGLALLRKHGAQFNALVVVNRDNAKQPDSVYRFLRDVAGAQFMQFIPCVEHRCFANVAPQCWTPESMPVVGTDAAKPGAANSAVMPWSVDPDDYGRFLCGVFDEWLHADVGQVYVQVFDAMLGLWLGMPSTLCVYAETCGTAMALERDGGLYACDHYVYPEYRRGTLTAGGDLRNRVFGEHQSRFGRDKSDTLPPYCRACKWLFACRGECPRNRMVRTPDNDPGLNYLCPGLRRFFAHIDPWMKRMAVELRAGRPARNVMANGLPRATREASPIAGSPQRRMALADSRQPMQPPGPNSPCPCGSGRKFKKCCMKR